jgi:uncharacterized membrane protein
MNSLIAASVAFFLIHAAVSGTGARQWLVDRIGLKVYLPLFSLASLGSIWWMSSAYGDVSDMGLLPLWTSGLWGHYLSVVVIFVAFILAAAGLLSKNPTAMGQEGALQDDDIAVGITRITRHPFLVGLGLWAGMHMITNADVGSLVFFGALLLVVVNGTRSIDRKRQKVFGEAWDKFAAQTSIIPFAAIVQGRNHLAIGEIGAVKILAGVVAFAALAWFHYDLFGVPTMLF